jgi:hypothetical protein
MLKNAYHGNVIVAMMYAGNGDDAPDAIISHADR